MRCNVNINSTNRFDNASHNKNNIRGDEQKYRRKFKFEKTMNGLIMLCSIIIPEKMLIRCVKERL